MMSYRITFALLSRVDCTEKYYFFTTSKKILERF